MELTGAQVRSSEEVFVKLCKDWTGRGVRGTTQNWEKTVQNLGTWGEHSFKEGAGEAWGNISVLEGCDGAAEVLSDDGSNVRKGFSEWIVDGAPTEAKASKRSGAKVIDKIVGRDANAKAREYIEKTLDPSMVDISNDRQTAFKSTNMRMKFIFHRGSF